MKTRKIVARGDGRKPEEKPEVRAYEKVPGICMASAGNFCYMAAKISFGKNVSLSKQHLPGSTVKFLAWQIGGVTGSRINSFCC